MCIENKIKCPICYSENSQKLLDLNCGNFDNSSLYQFAKINSCRNCGHIFNELTNREIQDLNVYYNYEYAEANLASDDNMGDRPGSDNINTTGRYDQLFTLIKQHIGVNSNILDVGCASGGFLDYLSKYDYENLAGVEPTYKYYKKAQKKQKYNIKMGFAEKIPFDDNVFDIVIMDQVLEHIVDPSKALNEAKRVLNKDGFLCVGIPDADRYKEKYFFDFFWFIMREHIQHFDIEHIKLLAQKEGFEFIGFSKTESPMMSKKMILPNINILFKCSDKNSVSNNLDGKFELTENIKLYINECFSQLLIKKNIIEHIAEKKFPVYVWGIGREFLYLYENAGLNKCNILGLIDINIAKQNGFKIDGKRIYDKSILQNSTSDSKLIISAIAHSEVIHNEAMNVGFRGGIIEI